MESWADLARPAPEAVTVAGVTVKAGSRVVLRPASTEDVLVRQLAGRHAVVESIAQDLEDTIYLAVTLEDDPARDLGKGRQLGHRFFLTPEEVQPLRAVGPAAGPARVLVAGIGNVFMGDDGFGVEVARRLGQRELPPGVEVVDFGIRGMDLAYALGDGYDAALLIDAVPLGGPPGTIEVIEPELEAGAEVGLEAHGMDPVRVLSLAGRLGRLPARTLVLGCQPQTLIDPHATDEVVAELSPPVQAAVEVALDVVETIVGELSTSHNEGGSQP